LALQGTVLGSLYESGAVSLISKEEYMTTVCDILEILPTEMVIQRLTADGYKDIFLGPAWAVNKMDVLNSIDWELKRRQTWQGIRCRKTEIAFHDE